MVKLEAYKAIEKTVSGVLFQKWKATGKQAVLDLVSALERKDFTAAYAIVKDLNLLNVVDDARPALTELGLSAVLFGASQVGPVAKSKFMKDKAMPEEVLLAINQLDVMLELNGTEIVTKRLTEFVQTQEKAAMDELYSVTKAEFDLANALNDAVLGSGKAVTDIAGNLTTSRLVSFGFLDEAVHNGILTYQVTEILDDVICPVCTVMHGRTFHVVEEHKRVLNVLRTQDPNELRTAAPWPKNTKAGVEALKSMTEEEMQQAGYGSPPYHPGCRGVLQLKGTVHPVVQVGQPVADVSIVQTPKVLFASVDDMYASDGSALAEAMLKDVDVKYKVSEFGRLADKDNMRILTVEFIDDTGKYAGEMTRIFTRTDNILSVKHETFVFTKKLTNKGIGKKVLSNSIKLYDSLGVEDVSLYASDDVGGYAWAKFGFIPDEFGWGQAKQFVSYRLKVLQLPKDIDSAVRKLIGSGDPKNIWAISDLTYKHKGTKLGKLLLMGSSWSGNLALKAHDQMLRFKAYVG